MDCPNCGLVNPASSSRCDCGYDFEAGTMKPRTSKGEAAPAPVPRERKGVMAFFMFDRMVAPVLIRFAYLIGAIMITISGLLILSQGDDSAPSSAVQAVTGVSVLVLGNLVWRITCELWIAVLDIRDATRAMARRSQQ